MSDIAQDLCESEIKSIHLLTLGQVSEIAYSLGEEDADFDMVILLRKKEKRNEEE